MEAITGGVSQDDLAMRLAMKAEAVKAKSGPPTPSPHKIFGEVIEDKAELCFVISKEALLAAIGPGNSSHRTQEGVYLAVDGPFTYVIDGKEYRFHLKLFPAWMRVDMLVG